MIRIIKPDHLNTEIAAIKKKIFFQKVSQLVRIIASPKQPQSETGFITAKYKVNGVMNNINPNREIVVSFRRIPKKRNTPKVNSTTANNIDPKRGRNSGV